MTKQVTADTQKDHKMLNSNPRMTKLYIDAAKNRQTERPPIWFMRQAGRYLPEYQTIRKKHGFLTMIRTPDLATEITLQPLRRFGMDAAILFSDILVVAEALGSSVEFVEKVGPVLPAIRAEKDFSRLNDAVDSSAFNYVYDAIRQIKSELARDFKETALVGFAGAPFTVASYMVEGGSSKDLIHTKRWIGQDPNSFKALLSKITDVTIDYLNGQIAAGVEALQLFDTWANHLNCFTFDEYSLFYIEKILKNLNNPNKIPVTVFCKGTGCFASSLFESSADMISCDAQTTLASLRQQYGDHKALQGNLDPYTLYATPERLTYEVTSILNAMKTKSGGYKGFVFNLGHGIFPDIDPDQVKRVVDLINR